MVGIVICLANHLGKVTVTSLAQMNPWSLRDNRHWQHIPVRHVWFFTSFSSFDAPRASQKASLGFHKD